MPLFYSLFDGNSKGELWHLSENSGEDRILSAGTQNAVPQSFSDREIGI
jgi:hypothetical protein